MPRIRQHLARLVARGQEGARYLGRQLPWYEPAQSQEGRNLRSLYAGTTWFGLISGLAATFIPVFALRLGATTGQLGWLTALPALVNVVWLVPAARIIERRRRRMPLILSTAFLQRLGYLAMAAMPFLLTEGRVEALIVLQTLVTLPTAVANTAITTLIPDLTAPERRGQVVSVRWLLLAVTATLAALAGGGFLDLLPVPLNYQILLGAGAPLSLLSLGALRRIRVPDAVTLSRRDTPR
ncbi:MAG TPA: MFS transporter, partial [Anaerolineae bacterium]|nr:MFS transporter [Anaerolineae bacterium]